MDAYINFVKKEIRTVRRRSRDFSQWPIQMLHISLPFYYRQLPVLQNAGVNNKAPTKQNNLSKISVA